MESNDAVVETVWGMSQDQVDEIRNEAIEKFRNAKHIWRQKGNKLICTSCDYHHAIYIGRKLMVGEKENGEPILVDRDRAIRRTTQS